MRFDSRPIPRVGAAAPTWGYRLQRTAPATGGLPPYSPGVPPRAARIDAEGIEHHVGPETLAAMDRFLAKTAKAGR